MTKKEKKAFEKWVKEGIELLDLKLLESKDPDLNQRIEDLLSKFVYSMDQILKRTTS